MELREWLIILGLALVTLIVIDGVRRLQRQRRTPRLDEVAGDGLQTASVDGPDPDAEARKAEVDWELPNGGARVVRPADFSSVQPKPKLERQEHPGPSRVLHEFRVSQQRTEEHEASAAGASSSAIAAASSSAADARPATDSVQPSSSRPSDGGRSEQPEKVAEAEQAVPPQAVISDSAPSAESSDDAAQTVTGAEPVSNEPVSNEPSDAGSEKVEMQAASAPSTSVDVDVEETPTSETTAASSEKKTSTKGASTERREPILGSADDEESNELAAEPLAANPDDHDEYDDDRYRLVDFEGMGDSFKTRSRQVGSSVQRFGASLQKSLAERRENKRVERERREKLKAEKAAEAARIAEQKAVEQKAAREAAEAEQARLELERQQQQARLELERQQQAPAAYDDDYDPLFAPRRDTPRFDYDGLDDVAEYEPALSAQEEPKISAEVDDGPTFADNSKVRVHPVLEKALRHDVNAEHARDSLANADEIIVISVMSRDPAGFPGSQLLELMMACGLRYSREMGIFHRFETEEVDSALQFSMVNVLKPGSFPIEAMDDFTTPGVTLLMPLPSATDTSAAFEAMVETAMVIVRHMGGELKDENRSVMTAQTVEFARQRVQEFERRHRLHRYQVN
ncbi:cell division protein ZipA [Halomonas huangheensis]|uniref:Cell division protein ZipA n=1 Tax=Halomonas huangheensis TaxID=1178482 RepID=W1N406_9GAMM|nr:cell division protein ZipA [Halomonas huangheensis]ALM51435.1 hypothetical protein AR456_03350 [Halomonas huangheensis]ERL49886.1 hypothetical protein BJB45_01835 [Halomonas huangheensis]